MASPDNFLELQNLFRIEDMDFITLKPAKDSTNLNIWGSLKLMEERVNVIISAISITLAVVSLILQYIVSNEHKSRIWATSAVGGITGMILGLIVYGGKFVFQIFNSVFSGVLISLLILLLCKISSEACRDEKNIFYDDGIPPRFYITGDKHRSFDHVAHFCKEMKTRKKDVLIILGDAGFNYYGDKRDDKLKAQAAKMNITFFCLQGNKENRPQNVGTYGVRNFHGGKVYYEPKYPNLFFAIDGQVYRFNGREYLVIGGAHSVDKLKCLEKNLPYFEDEMPNTSIIAAAEEQLAKRNYQIYGMLTHTCPIHYLPTEMFLTTKQKVDQKRKPHKSSKKQFKLDIDRSTEQWLGKIEKNLNYKRWFCGHYHVDKQIDKITMMCHEIQPLYINEEEYHHGNY